MPAAKQVVQMTPEEISKQFGATAVAGKLAKVGDNFVVVAGRKRITLKPDMVPLQSLEKLVGKDARLILDKNGKVVAFFIHKIPGLCYIPYPLFLHRIDPVIRLQVIDLYTKIIPPKLIDELKRQAQEMR